jgi:hypothetical protein
MYTVGYQRKATAIQSKKQQNPFLAIKKKVKKSVQALTNNAGFVCIIKTANT